MEITKNTCKNYGNHFSGTYCKCCGEKVFSAHDKFLSHLLEEVFHFMTHFEGNGVSDLVVYKAGRRF